MPSYLPAFKFFTFWRGTTFDYQFQYVVGTPQSSTPFDLTDYTATWIICDPSLVPVYGTYTTSASPGQSGVFFGGETSTPINGIIDLVVDSTDTAAFTWTTASHQLVLYDPSGASTLLLTGGTSVIGTFPS